jgi:hypothetical protein
MSWVSGFNYAVRPSVYFQVEVNRSRHTKGRQHHIALVENTERWGGEYCKIRDIPMCREQSISMRKLMHVCS